MNQQPRSGTVSETTMQAEREPSRLRVQWWNFTYWCQRKLSREAWEMRIAFVLPRRITYWCYVRVMSHAWAKLGNVHPDEVTYIQACEQWEKK